MGKNQEKKIKMGQSVLELVLTILVAVILLIAIASTWTHYTRTMVERMDRYKATRGPAADIHGARTGEQVRYIPEKLNLFGFGSPIGGPVSYDPIDGSYADCDTAKYEELMNYSSTLQNLSVIYQSESANVTQRDMFYRLDLIQHNTWRLIASPHGRFWEVDASTPLVILADSTGGTFLFQSDWNAIEDRLRGRISQYIINYNARHFLTGCLNVAFENFTHSRQLHCFDNCHDDDGVPGLPGIVGSIHHNIINPARSNLQFKRPLDLKVNILETLIGMAEKIANSYLHPCTWRVLRGEEDACAGPCLRFLSAAESALRATVSCIEAAANNNLPAVELCRNNQFVTAQDTLNRFENCYRTGCGHAPWELYDYSYDDPCYHDPTCSLLREEAQGLSRQAQEACDSYDYIRCGELSNLSYVTHDAYIDCYDTCRAR